MENRKKTDKEKVSIEILICHDTARGKELKRILISYVRTLIVVLALLAAPAYVKAQVIEIETDPLLIAAVEAQTNAIKSELNKQNETTLAIMGIDTGIKLDLSMIHDYTQKMYDYLSTVQTVVANASDIASSLNLSMKILNKLGTLAETAVDHPEGAVVTAMTSQMYPNLLLNTTSLVGYISSLVKTGGSGNLLNSYERTEILARVKSTLWDINRQLNHLIGEIKFMKIRHLFNSRLLGDSYYNIAGSKAAYERAKRDIEEMVNRHK